MKNPTEDVLKEAIKQMEYDKAPTWKYIDFFKHLENDLKEEREEQTIKLSELRNMTLEEIKELLNN